MHIFFLFLSHFLHLFICCLALWGAKSQPSQSGLSIWVYCKLGVEIAHKGPGLWHQSTGRWGCSWVSPTGLLETEVQDGTWWIFLGWAKDSAVSAHLAVRRYAAGSCWFCAFRAKFVMFLLQVMPPFLLRALEWKPLSLVASVESGSQVSHPNRRTDMTEARPSSFDSRYVSECLWCHKVLNRDCMTRLQECDGG